MQQGMMRRGRFVTARGVSVARLLITLLVGFVAGVLSLAAFERATLRQPAAPQPISVPPASAPQPALEPAAAEHTMSAREAAQYRAFYAQQMASEAELERWSLAPRAAPRVSPAQGDFYAQQMASEAELERWAAPAQPSGDGYGGSSAPRVSDGAQFE